MPQVVAFRCDYCKALKEGFPRIHIGSMLIKRKEALAQLRSEESNLDFCTEECLIYQFEQFLTYKAEAVGKQVVKVDARYTSQKCSSCGHIAKDNRNLSRFSCNRCGYVDHSDINAAKNILQNYLLSSAMTERQGIVNYPNVTESLLNDIPF